MDIQPKHVNAAGIMGGNALCGSQIGNVMMDYKHATCPECLHLIIAFYDAKLQEYQGDSHD